MDLLNYLADISESKAFNRLSPETQTIVVAAVEAAAAIEKSPRAGKAKSGEGPRSIITAADYRSQKVIFTKLTSRFPEARILCEEKTSDPAALSPKHPVGILGKGLHFVVDPIDGTTPFSHRQGDWSIGIGAIRDGIFHGGVVLAPMMNSGLLVFAERGKGAFFKEGLHPVQRISRKANRFDPKESIVKVGVDARLYPNLRAMETEIAMNVQGLYIAGSGLLALANVALGRVALVFQTPEKSWDWAQALPLLEEAGRFIWFYRLENGTVVPVAKPDQRAFTLPRNTNGLGFIAGEPALARKVRQLLPKKGWDMLDPDTVIGAW
jgi:myo-inositol-1(or 4)-monophosphatase